MCFRLFCLLCVVSTFFACDETTTGIGESIVPDYDRIAVGASSYEVSTRSILADSLYSRSSMAYLGKYTDPEYGEMSADFVAQFNITDDFTFPAEEQRVYVKEAYMLLNFASVFGDTANAMKLQVDTLSSVIPEDDKRTCYTSIDVEKYYDASASPLTTQSFAASGASMGDTIITSSSYYSTVETRYRWLPVELPKQFGQYCYSKYLEDATYYKNAEEFIKHVLKGVYVHCTHGDGTVLCIDQIDLNVGFYFYIDSSTGKLDSLVSGMVTFAASKEVIQANRFKNSEKLKELVADESCTRLKTPAGIFTEVSLPIDEILMDHQSDTINAASITFQCYNDEPKSYGMSKPQSLLMVRKDDMSKFFENSKIYDGVSSFVTTLVTSGSTANTYTFSNIAPLVRTCMDEKSAGKFSEDWNKVVLIPVNITNDSSGNVIRVEHDLGISGTRLKGGKDKLKLDILYSKLSF
ncbi:MAG: DUF4270 domain-containing protein [Bacteroidia bacterium]|nr:DUF4270 domain-containing protein [Bacteroidia bacterium]